jgi:plastocyanin
MSRLSWKMAAFALAGLMLAWPAGAGTLSGTVEVAEAVGNSRTALADRSNAVIFLSGFREPPPPGAEAELAQENKAFNKRVLVITQGQGVSFPNHDNIHHNVWSKSGTKAFDLGLYKNPDSKLVTFDKPGMVQHPSADDRDDPGAAQHQVRRDRRRRCLLH